MGGVYCFRTEQDTFVDHRKICAKQTESFSCVFYPSWLIWPFQVQSLAASTGPNWWDMFSKTTLLSLGSKKCLLLLTSCLISKCYSKCCCDISNAYLLRSKTGINRTIKASYLINNASFPSGNSLVTLLVLASGASGPVPVSCSVYHLEFRNAANKNQNGLQMTSRGFKITFRQTQFSSWSPHAPFTYRITKGNFQKLSVPERSSSVTVHYF